MHRSLLTRQIAPAVLGYLGLIAATILLDVILHRAGLMWIGLYLGPAGTGLIALSFLYSLRKRKKISFGAPRKLLELHETLSWVGALLILVHAGIHINAIIPWLAVLAMLVVVASGFTGSVLVKRATDVLKAQKASGVAGEDNTVLDAMTLDLMKKWRLVHMPINAVFLALFAVHLAAVLLFRHW
jgi:cytochrome b561